jgi:hypothetical protein
VYKQTILAILEPLDQLPVAPTQIENEKNLSAIDDEKDLPF